MSYDFSAKDIFAIAKQIERNGAAFYKTAAASVSDSSEREFLMNLSKMEEQHEGVFSKLESELSANEKSDTVFDPQDEAMLYLKALADTRVFFEKEIDTSTLKEILKAAITAEKDSIVFYLGMKSLVPEKYGNTRIDQIIKEEMGHIRLLSRELTAIK